jgi:hypothetical protein
VLLRFVDSFFLGRGEDYIERKFHFDFENVFFEFICSSFFIVLVVLEYSRLSSSKRKKVKKKIGNTDRFFFW